MSSSLQNYKNFEIESEQRSKTSKYSAFLCSDSTFKFLQSFEN